MNAARPASPCPVCGEALSDGDWCARCALGEVMADGPEGAAGLFGVAGHTVLGELGRGAAGIVYRARQENPAREVALKILRPHEAASAESRARFRQEAATVAALDHPAILPVLSVGEQDGLPYFTMKLCAGGSLAQRAPAYRGRWHEIAVLVATLADAVQHAHARGVLHRDLKPGNILFDDEGRPFVSDFGIAKTMSAEGVGAPVTQPHEVMGTRGYLAPEVLSAGASAATLAADVFGLGAILHELLAGAPPAEGAAAPATLAKGVPRDLVVIAAKGLAPEPAARYATAAALADDLRAWLAGRPIAARPVSVAARIAAWARRRPALAALAAVLVLTIAGATIALALKNRELREAFARTEASLADALVAQARAVRQSGAAGQRRDALALLARAAKIEPSPAARDEAVAALALPDWEKPRWIRVASGEPRFAVPSPDFTRVLVDDDQGEFTLREVTTGAIAWTWRAPVSSASMPVFSPDGRWVAVRLQDDTAWVLASADARVALKLEARPYALKGPGVPLGLGQDMDFSPDGARVAITRPAGGVTFHRLPGGEPDGEWSAPEVITVISFSPDGARLAAGGGVGTAGHVLAIVDAATGRTQLRQTGPVRVELLAWSGDGRWLAMKTAGRFAEVRNTRDLSLRTLVPDRRASHARFLADGNRLMLGERAGETRLWDVDQARLLLAKFDGGWPGTWYAGEPLSAWRTHRGGRAQIAAFSESPVLRSFAAVNGMAAAGAPIAASADGRWLMVGGIGAGALVDLAGRHARIPVPGVGPADRVTLRIDEADGALWVAHTESGLWRHDLARAGADGWGAPGPGVQVDAEAGYFCADFNARTGRLALVTLQEGAVKIVDVRTRTVVARWRHAGAASAAFAPDGARIVVTGERVRGAPAMLYDAATGAKITMLGEEPDDSAAWSPDGRWIYSALRRDRSALWRADGSRGPELPPHGDERVHAGAFSPDGRWLARAEASRSVRLIETETGRSLATFSSPEPASWISGLVFVDNDRLCVLTMEGRVLTWGLPALRRELGAVGLDWAER